MTVKRMRPCYSNTSRLRFTVISHTPMRSRFYHTHIMYKGNWDDFCLVNSIYFALHIFLIFNLLHCVDESWWNMPFKETRLGDGVADDAVAMLLPLWLHAAALWCHAVSIRIVTSHNAWMGYEYSLQTFNRPRAIHKHNPHPSKQWGVCDNSCIHLTTGYHTATAHGAVNTPILCKKLWHLISSDVITQGGCAQNIITFDKIYIDIA